MPSTGTLSARQAKFVAEYLVDGNGSRAALAAGYGESGRSVAAVRLLGNASVQKAIQARQRADATRLSTQREDALQGLLLAIGQAQAMGDPATMIAGWREVSRLMGYYAPEVRRVVVEDRGEEALRGRLESLSDAELAALVAGDVIAG